MSDVVELAGESFGGDRPAKKPKHNEIVAFGGPMDDEETARKKLEEAGFDPDKPLDPVFPLMYPDHFPVTYFCSVGDLMMCRYLLSKGASTTQSWVDDDEDDAKGLNSLPSPMFAAARGGHLDICKWLCEYGASKDIQTTNNYYCSPLCTSVTQISEGLGIDSSEIESYRKVCRWLILNGALCPNDDGIISLALINEALVPAFAQEDGYEEAEVLHLIEWAKDTLRTQESFMTFLMGTYLRDVPTFTTEGFEAMLGKKFHSPVSKEIILNHLPEAQRRLLWGEERNDCALQCLSGHPEIRKHIADMLGVVRGTELRMMRGLRRCLEIILEHT